MEFRDYDIDISSETGECKRECKGRFGYMDSAETRYSNRQDNECKAEEEKRHGDLLIVQFSDLLL